MTWLFTPFLGLTRGLWLLIAAAVLAGGAWGWLTHHTNAAVVSDRNAASAKVTITARAADQTAAAVVNSTREGIEDANRQARAAADSGDDPLGDGLRSLRNHSAR